MEKNASEISKKINAASKVRYIKLGEGGIWAKNCFENKIIRLGYSSGSNPVFEHASQGDWGRVKEYWIKEGRSQSTATNFTNQIRVFWEDQGDVLWVTFENGFLYYGFSMGAIKIDGGPVEENYSHLSSYKQMDGNGWRNVDVNGQPLITTQLSGALTKTAGYRGTICSFSPEMETYIKNRVCGSFSHNVAKAEDAKLSLQNAIKPLVKTLTAPDFEILVALIFSNSGWKRISAVGGVQKTTDFDLENTVTGESAFVQVKSESDQAEFESYVQKKLDSHYSRMFYVYHTPKNSGAIVSSDDDGLISLWDIDKVAEQVLKGGLVDWVITHSK